MGGLFSSEYPETSELRHRQSTPAYNNYSWDQGDQYYTPSRTISSSSPTRATYGTSGTNYGSSTRSGTSGRNSLGSNGYSRQSQWSSSVTETECEDFIHSFKRLALKPREEIKASKLDKGLFHFSYPAVTYTQLNPLDDDYLVVSRMVTNKKRFKIDRIERINNPFLKNAYELKKLQKQNEHGYVHEKLLFHGTKNCLVNQICTFNFDYRKIVKHKYGKGVSFSPNSTYAANYSDQNVNNKVILVAKVLIVNSCIGSQNLIVPPPGYDTTQKGFDGIVTVKYEDNEYYPAFKIHYHTVGQLNQNHPQRRRNLSVSPVTNNSPFDYY